MSHLRHFMAVGAAVVLALGAAPSTPGSPLEFATTLAHPERVTGIVAEHLSVHSYTYIKLRERSGWFVYSGPPPAENTPITLRVYASTSAYRSARLERLFSPLMFASLVSSTGASP
jgi:hypothetical protein